MSQKWAMLLPSPLIERTKRATNERSVPRVVDPVKRSRQGHYMKPRSNTKPTPQIVNSPAVNTEKTFPNTPAPLPGCASGETAGTVHEDPVTAAAIRMFRVWSVAHPQVGRCSSAGPRCSSSAALCEAASALRLLRLQIRGSTQSSNNADATSIWKCAAALQNYFTVTSSPPSAGDSTTAIDVNEHRRLSLPVLTLFFQALHDAKVLTYDDLAQWLIGTFEKSADIQLVLSYSTSNRLAAGPPPDLARILWTSVETIISVVSHIMSQLSTPEDVSSFAGAFIRALLRAIFATGRNGADHASDRTELHKETQENVRRRRRRLMPGTSALDALIALLFRSSETIDVRSFVSQTTERDVLGASFLTPPQSVIFLNALSS